MSRSIRIFDDEIIAKKVFTKIENASKLPLNYINKNRDKYTKDIKTGKLISKNMFRKNTEVVVKITSGSKNSQALSKHLDYISRDGNVELITNDFDRYAGEDEILEVKRIFKNEGSPIPLYKEGAKEKRHTINMVFSMKEHSTTPKEKLQQAVITTLKRMYPNNFFVVAFHNDTDNPHCHVCLKVADKNGKRINPKKADLANLRAEFAKALNELGVEAKATKKQREVEINQEFSVKLNTNNEINQALKIKMHYYQIMDFGEANYQFSTDKNAKKSYYVSYKTKKGITTIWGQDLERVVKENKVLRGEYARFKIVGQEEYEIKRKAKINNKWQEVVKTLKKPVWDVSVVGREKELKQITKKYKITHDKGVNNERDYTKQYRQRVLQELGNKSTIRREVAQERNFMRILSEQPMVHNTKRTQMLLHINALNQLQQGERGRSDNILRWTSARNNEITRDE
ncbi:MobP1 family relaxase [Campylobacter jejuni]|uniref:MobP1 family relaxase n=1 Tax=Campylobacter jejuni TaxID=197 RepID=UPI00043558B8|nr:MobP1 family relaxase [Campylobacter jejuni]ECQ5437013.1 relaxase/mobilization nuclease domain-containing protein [Campylobacter coli]ECL2740935.1 spore coat protein CotH [Campylobacter jejuni]ECL3306207.1 spore coat protein CotH [Campylobacter jejuni]ECL4326268.1 spore coat protein CotH [Campylobacter jejuni]ECQ1564284.1 relaxase/mobilization nuclease domain-containing protein [Campylobacter jejuni]